MYRTTYSARFSSVQVPFPPGTLLKLLPLGQLCFTRFQRSFKLVRGGLPMKRYRR